MRAANQLRIEPRTALQIRHCAMGLFELFLFAGYGALLEYFGAFAPHDTVDLLLASAIVCQLLVMRGMVVSGWMPISGWIAKQVRGIGRRLHHMLAPRYTLAFRRSAQHPTGHDSILLVPIVVLCVLACIAIGMGHALFPALLKIKAIAGYIPYIALLLALWSLLGIVIAFGMVSAAQWIQDMQRRHRREGLLFLVSSGVWVGGLLAMALLPGIVPVLAIAYIGTRRALAIGRGNHETYYFCRRGKQGQARYIPVRAYLRRRLLAATAFLVWVTALGQSGRLWDAAWPEQPFAFTTWLALLASLCGLVLLEHAGVHFRRMVGRGAPLPEVPLVPTLWIRSTSPTTQTVHDDTTTFWRDTATREGWHVVDAQSAPRTGFDLMVGDPNHPQRLEPRGIEGIQDPFAVELSPADAAFRLTRRFHVTKRRMFFRRLKTLFKALRHCDRSEGTGFLFCPHVWLIPGVTRDADPRSTSTSGPQLHGPLYADVFSHRIRRYVGAMLRDMDIDVIFWEDAVGFADVRRVLRVMFENHDQSRTPARASQFAGIPRVRVLIQSEIADFSAPTDDVTSSVEDTSFEEAMDHPTHPTSIDDSPQGSPGSTTDTDGAVHTRLLMILRDRGGEDETTPVTPVDHGLRSPVLSS